MNYIDSCGLSRKITNRWTLCLREDQSPISMTSLDIVFDVFFFNTASSYIRGCFSHKTHIIAPLSTFTENVTKYYLPLTVLAEYILLYSIQMIFSLQCWAFLCKAYTMIVGASCCPFCPLLKLGSNGQQRMPWILQCYRETYVLEFCSNSTVVELIDATVSVSQSEYHWLNSIHILGYYIQILSVVHTII